VGWKARLPLLAAALWWGSLGAIGFMAVPLLFSHLPTPALAGGMAARLFTAQSWLSLACGALILMAARADGERPGLDWGRGAFGVVLAGMLLALLIEFAVAPRIVARQNLALWHGAGSAMYLAQWLCAGIALWKLAAPARAAPQADEL
jgi:hypothetical protein